MVRETSQGESSGRKWETGRGGEERGRVPGVLSACALAVIGTGPVKGSDDIDLGVTLVARRAGGGPGRDVTSMSRSVNGHSRSSTSARCSRRAPGGVPVVVIGPS
eukprot:6582901-Pyramimonas_sp.AAC.1